MSVAFWVELATLIFIQFGRGLIPNIACTVFKNQLALEQLAGNNHYLMLTETIQNYTNVATFVVSAILLMLMAKEVIDAMK